MKQWLKQWCRHTPAVLLSLCYGAAALVWLVSSLWVLGADALASVGGRLYQYSLEPHQFECTDLELQPDGSYQTTSEDPQMLWQNTGDITVLTLRMDASFDRDPREMCLYYTTKPGEDFGVNKRVFASLQDDGSYLFRLPHGHIEALRLDPCSPLSGQPVNIRFLALEFNQPQPWWQYFVPGWYGLFGFLVYPALAASALSLLWQAVCEVRSRAAAHRAGKQA